MRGVLQDENLQFLYVYGSKFASDERRMVFTGAKKNSANQQAESDFSQLLSHEMNALSVVV